GHLDDHVGWGVGGDRRVREQLVADDLGVDAGLFQYLALRGLGWVLVRVDVTAGVEPPADLVVMHQQDAVLVVEDDRGGGEVADAGHGVAPARAMAATRAATHSTVASGIAG